MKRILLLLCCLLLLSGCTVKFVYNQLDWLIPWYLSDYIGFTQEQNSFLKTRVNEHLYWHRRTQLPSYANGLYELQAHLQDGLTPEELDYHSAAIEVYWKNLLNRITPDAAALLVTISDNQVDELLSQLEQKNREYQSKYVDISTKDLRRKRAKLVRKHLKRWLGSLTDEQRQAVAQWSERYQPTSRDTLGYRKQWHAQFRQALAQRHNDSQFMETLNDLLYNPEKGWSADYQQKLDSNRELSRDLILEIDRLMTPDQRAYAMNKLTSLAGDFDQLAGVTN